MVHIATFWELEITVSHLIVFKVCFNHILLEPISCNFVTGTVSLKDMENNYH